MIRISKSTTIPPSLLVNDCSNYNGQDVQETLVTDQHHKCYLCEQKTTKSFEIEHLKAKTIGYFPQLKYTWSNLFLSCPYCNGRKPNDFDLLDPVSNDIENILAHRIDLATGNISIKNLRTGVQEEHTVKLLERLFNGKNNLRDIKCEVLIKDLKQEIILFLGFLNDYKTTKSIESKQRVLDSLLITKEFLAFKYWIVKDNDSLYDDFKDYMIWNKANPTSA